VPEESGIKRFDGLSHEKWVNFAPKRPISTHFAPFRSSKFLSECYFPPKSYSQAVVNCDAKNPSRLRLPFRPDVENGNKICHPFKPKRVTDFNPVFAIEKKGAQAQRSGRLQPPDARSTP
jgi:hypothetical protein